MNMKSAGRKLLLPTKCLAAVLLAAALMLALSMPTAAGRCMPTDRLYPIIFVHGGSGSAAQFESQAMRFASNGYPPELITAFEYDSSFTINTMADVYNRLDEHIARVMAETGAPKVNVLGHSLGTTVMHGYLAYPERAAKVANYVNIDGRTAAAPPGGVRTLAIWAGMGTPGREIVGAINVTIPGQTHVQVATSAESFAEMYRFFTGEEPATTEIIPQPRGQVRVAGRAVFFPLNAGVEGATVQMWEVDPATGRRMRKKPDASCVVGADGAWGPFKAKGGSSYEFVILREGFRAHHFYTEPLIRSDYLVRLNTSPPGGVGDLLDTSDRHANLVITRNKELWGDQGTNNDVLLVDGVNVVTPAGCALTKRTIGMFVYDWHADGASDRSAPIPFLHSLPFLTGVDLFVPAADPPDRTISLVLFPRGGGGRTQVVNVPAWASSGHAVTVMFNDFRQDANTWVEYVRALRE
ncbi:alpha/beta fold hydrolase [Candidatus Solincola tengchongensis]|uniref:alpha/beta fold hydrolase n=1 Tax=Candidatus Solincola tengchongensis TaxID=2900693 RepID=UPI00257EAA66|nr:alpha/beta fold hydrolase [Candidatus Solincola tengchongensis]